jgi:hypothetical protein
VCPGGAIGLPVDGRLKRSIISVDVVRKYKSTNITVGITGRENRTHCVYPIA